MVSKRRSFRKLLPALGIALVASLALSAVGVASASAAVPKNVTKPVISPATPHPGVTLTTTNGTWTESPTSYFYEWYRCNGGCSIITGAYSSSYTPVQADMGYSFKVEVSAYNGEGHGTASASTPVMVPRLGFWYANGTKLLAGSSKAITMKATTPISIEWKYAGNSIKVSCTTLTSTKGSVENPAGGASGDLRTNLSLSGCTVSKPLFLGCTVQGGSVYIPEQVRATATEYNGKPTLLSESKALPWIFLTIQGCEAWAGEYKFAGSIAAYTNAASSTSEFGKAGGNLTWAGTAATFEGTSKLELTSGEALTLVQ